LLIGLQSLALEPSLVVQKRFARHDTRPSWTNQLWSQLGQDGEDC
jgi:hypothetical protein